MNPSIFKLSGDFRAPLSFFLCCVLSRIEIRVWFSKSSLFTKPIRPAKRPNLGLEIYVLETFSTLINDRGRGRSQSLKVENDKLAFCKIKLRVRSRREGRKALIEIDSSRFMANLACECRAGSENYVISNSPTRNIKLTASGSKRRQINLISLAPFRSDSKCKSGNVQSNELNSFQFSCQVSKQFATSFIVHRLASDKLVYIVCSRKLRDWCEMEINSNKTQFTEQEGASSCSTRAFELKVSIG